MDNHNKKDPGGLVNGWLDEILKKVDIPGDPPKTANEEIGPDEHAIAKAGLTHPDDMELQQIVQETMERDFGSTDATDATCQFTPQTTENPQPDDTAPAEEPEKESLIRKFRPKGKKGYGLWGLPHVLSTAIWLALILAIGISLGRTAWLCAKDLLALGKESINVSITIEPDDDIDSVAQKLKEAGLIEYPRLFVLFTEFTGKGETLREGTIEFNAINPNDPDSGSLVYDYNALANALSYRGSIRVTVDVMIPEGYNCAQIFALMEEKGVCSAASLEKYAANGKLDSYWFLDGVERGHKYCLEGFLFPDTYQFYLNDDPERVLEKMLNGFDNRFSDRMIDKLMALNEATGLKMTLRDVVTMASIVEKEKASDLEGYTISSVFYNRLRKPGSYPYLQSDATIKYDVDYRSKGELITDAQINASPYNTYTKKGLPAGPIANPGLASLDAALDPEDTNYYFFIYDKNAGMHRFSKTLAEHNEWARKLGLA